MSFRTRRVLFITPFYMLFQFFLLKYIFSLFCEVNDVYFLIAAILIGLMHCLPMFFESKKSTVVGRFFSTVDGVWMWVSVMFLIDIVVIYVIWSIIDLSLEIRCLLLSVVPILAIYNYYKAHKLVVSQETLFIENLHHDVNIAHLSDVHFGSVRHKQIIESIASKLKEIEDDCHLAVISGDLADGSSCVLEDDFQPLSKVNMPIIFTPGNHDFYPGIENVIKACKKAGIIVLDNDSVELEELNIFGLRFSIDDKSAPKLDKSVINPNLVNILNYHVPYHWEEFSKLGFDLQLSGHTHGGQFYPAVWFANLIFKYNMGLFKNNLGKYLHVTTGVGSMDVPMRWGTSSEIVILKLKKR